MANNFLQATKQKIGHVFGAALKGARRGGQWGLVAGAVLGVAALFTMGAPLTIMGVASFMLFGSVAGGLGGAGLGSAIGGLSGLLTRSRPDGARIIADANECAKDKQVEQVLPQEPQMAPQIQQTPQRVSPTPQQAAPAPQMQAQKQGLDEIKKLSEALGSAQSLPQADTATPVLNSPAATSDAQVQSWASKVQENAHGTATMQR